MGLSKDLIDFINLLKKNDVAFAICGGHAVGFHGYPRATLDLDILLLPNEENAKKIIFTLHEFGFGNCGIPLEAFLKEKTAITLGEQPNQIDLLTSMSLDSTKDILSRSIEGALESISVLYVGREDLIRAKKEAARPKDLADLDELRKFSNYQ